MHDARALVAAAIVIALLAHGPLSTDRVAGGDGTPPPPASVLFSPEGLSPEVLISRVYASAARDDEFVELANVGFEAMDLGSWSLSDGEAAATFPLETWLMPGARLVATRNSTSFAEDTLEIADLTYDRGPATGMQGGVLRLADAGDEVLLLDGGKTLVDAYVYGASDYAGPGWAGPPARALGRGELAVRAAGDGILRDRDTREDWDGLRDFRLGQSAFESVELATIGPARAFISPEDSRDGLLSFLESARTTADVSVYTLTSEAIAGTLAGLARSGVRVRILLDGAPVGGINEHGRMIAAGLAQAGAEVRFLRGDTDVVKRYRYLHAKYAVLDRARVFISSENFGDAGFPTDGDAGNRGWSVAIEDADLADALDRVFESDFDPRRRDSIAAEPTTTETFPEPPGIAPWSPGPSSAPRRARLVVAPDTALEPSGLLDLLASAQDRLWIEAFYIEETWGDVPNPFLEAAFDAARRGVQVRILLDGSWWNTDEEMADNDDAIAHINERAAFEGLRLEARLVEPAGPIDRVHNKGVLVDGRAVFVSSMNWALASATQNREVGLILEDPAIAGTFERALWEDWDGPGANGGDPFHLTDPVAVGAIYAIVAAAAVGSMRKLRGTSKGLKPRAPMETRGRPGPHLRGRRGKVRLLPAQLVAEPGPRAGGGPGDRRGGEAPRGHLEGPEGDRGP